MAGKTGMPSDGPSGDITLTQYASPDVDIVQIEEMLKGDPLNEGLLDIAAFAYYSSNQLERALVAYATLIKIDAQNPLYHYCLANTYYRMRRFEEAYREWKVTVSLDEDGRYGRRARKRLELVRAGGTAGHGPGA